LTGSISNALSAMVALLRTNVTTVSNRVYPPEVRADSQMPRITVDLATPSETYAGPGAGIPVWKNVMFRIDIWHKEEKSSHKMIREVADQVEQAIATTANRNYSTNTVNGQFYLLRIAGGSETTLDSLRQLYKRTVLVSGRWMQTA